jgi:DNA-binding CsgD family transcriptional regulator/tetratricopeptide (TPR) repeat protein
MAAGYTSARFVGRERELARLAVALEGAAGGRSSTLLIGASAGIGVSRLLTETRQRLAGLPEPFEMIRCRARSGRSGDPYAPVSEAFARLLAGIPDPDLPALVGTGAEELVRLIPSIEGRLAGLGALPSRSTTIDPERRQTRMLEAILGLLTRLGERRPVVLTLEDLHAADAGTRALAAFLARVSRPGRLCVLATYQPDELTRQHPLHATLAAMADAARPPDRFALEPFRRDELARLIESIEGERPSASVLLLVAERSRGNALVAEEILAARRELAGASLTGSLDELVVARLAGRSPECRRVLRLLAPAGEPLTLEQLSSASLAFEREADRPAPRSSSSPRRGGGILEADLGHGLAEALEHGFGQLEGPDGEALSPTGSVADGSIAELPAEAVVGIRHPLIARSIEADLLPGQRRRHHAALAEGLTDRPGAQARHWLAAHELGPARVAAIEAATLAETVDSLADALAHLELALELDDRTNPGGGEADQATPANLLGRAAEAAFADGRPGRAAAYAESAIARLDERSDRLRMGLLFERLGRYRRAAGDQDGSISAHCRAVELVPPEPSRERAVVLGALAQVRMLEGTFTEAERLAVEAIEVARAVGPEALGEEGHAICTLGISRVWGEDPEGGLELLLRAREIAAELARFDDIFRATANLTTALDVLGRKREAVEVARVGIEAAQQAGQEAVFGNYLRGNGADSLFLLGDWAASRALVETALEWSPVGVNLVNALSNLAIVEIETRAGEVAGRLLGRLLLELETVPDAQDSVPTYQAAASFALWRGDLEDARRAVARGWGRVRETEDWVLVARMAAVVLEVDAVSIADARGGRDLATVAEARGRSATVLAEAEAAVRDAGVAAAFGSRREADAHLALARAYRARIEGRDEPVAWDALARTWEQLERPYQVARARWRQAEAALAAGDGRAGRLAAKAPLIEAVRLSRELGAGPLLRELTELAGRAMINLPEAVPAVVGAGPDGELEAGLGGSPVVGSVGIGLGFAGEGERGALVAVPIGGGPSDSGLEPAAWPSAAILPGRGELERPGLASAFVGPAEPPPGDTFGLSRREREVLVQLAQGRTNREIGERLFISQKTVGVHVGNILAKLGVSGRVEAAAVAIRLGLTESA